MAEDNVVWKAVKLYIHNLKDKHPRMWCVFVCLVLSFTIPLALLYEIVVLISVELLRKIYNLVMYNSFRYIIVAQLKCVMRFIAYAKKDVVEQWKKGAKNEGT